MKPDLIKFLMTKGKQPFDIVTNNCFEFTNDCWEIYHGHRWCDQKFAGLHETPWDNFLDAADHYLERSQKPQEGHLVALDCRTDTYLHGLVTGFCTGNLSVFLNTKGVKYLPTKLIKYSWKNRYDNI